MNNRQNLLLGANGYIRVVDFGFAKVMEEGKKVGMTLFDPVPLAPPTCYWFQ